MDTNVSRCIFIRSCCSYVRRQLLRTYTFGNPRQFLDVIYYFTHGSTRSTEASTLSSILLDTTRIYEYEASYTTCKLFLFQIVIIPPLAGLFYGLGVLPGKRYDSFSEIPPGWSWTVRIAKLRIERKKKKKNRGALAQPWVMLHML